MIVEGALGDAYGAGFEFAPREKIDQFNRLKRYEYHPKFSSVYKRYTDDTQMALALAEFILEGSEWNARGIADKMVEVFKRDPREGYGWKFHKALSESDSGEALLQNVDAQSKRNGAVMRAYPVGIFSQEVRVMERAKIQAELTHNTVEAIMSAQAVALMLHFCYYRKGALRELPGYLADLQGTLWNNRWSGEVQIDAVQSTEAVLTVLTRSEPSLKKMLIDSVALGGDVDTVGSLVMAIASQADEVEQDLPEWMYTDIEDGHYGLSYIKNIDRKLQALYSRSLN